jgi:hypothetical protein
MYIIYPYYHLTIVINNLIYIIQISSMNIHPHIISIFSAFSITSIYVTYLKPIISIMSYIIYPSIIITSFAS